MANIVNPADYLPAENQEGFTSEEIQEGLVARTAAGLGRRQQLQHDLGGITDADVDGGSFSTQQADAEAALQAAISEANRATDPAARAAASSRAEQLAAALVGYQQNQKAEVLEEQVTSARSRLENNSIDVDGVLEWAADQLADDSIDGFNELIGGKDQELQYQAVQFLDHARTRPDQYIHLDSEDLRQFLTTWQLK